MTTSDAFSAPDIPSIDSVSTLENEAKRSSLLVGVPPHSWLRVVLSAKFVVRSAGWVYSFHSFD